MSTEQSYVGRGNNANTFEQTAENSPQTAQIEAQPQTTPFDPTDPVATLRELTNELVETSLDFCDFKNPIPHLIELIDIWSYRDINLNALEKRNQLRQLLRVVSFVAEVHRLVDQIEHFTEEANQQQKEVSNGN